MGFKLEKIIGFEENEDNREVLTVIRYVEMCKDWFDGKSVDDDLCGLFDEFYRESMSTQIHNKQYVYDNIYWFKLAIENICNL